MLPTVLDLSKDNVANVRLVASKTLRACFGVVNSANDKVREIFFGRRGVHCDFFDLVFEGKN